MELNPAQFRLLLVGPRVSRLQPFFTARGFVVDACVSGGEAMQLMQQAPRHVLLLELELEDMLCADLLAQARAKNLAGSVILLEDPIKSGLIVSTLVRGVDGYVATPPDEAYLFRVVERQLLAQWALAQGAASSKDAEDKARAERQVAQERAKVTELVKEIASLREEVAKAKKSAPSAVSASAASATVASAPAAVSAVAATKQRKAHVPDERTSPTGHAAPRGLGGSSGPGSLDHGFDDDPLTAPGNPTQPVRPNHGGRTQLDAKKKMTRDDEGDDLFLDLDDTAAGEPTGKATVADDDDDLLNLDD